MRAKKAALPYIVWMLIFTIVPLGIVAYFAFTDDVGRFTFENILRIGEFIPTLWESIKLGGIATIFCILLGYPMAYIISRSKARAQQTMVMILMLPMWMNFLLRTYSWMTLLEDTGLINSFLQRIGLPVIHMINTPGAVVLGMVYNFLPFMILPIYSVMVKIDFRVVEAAQDLGANALHVFRRVIFPLSVPGICSGITMVFVPAVSTFVISKMLGGSLNMLIGDVIEMMFVGSSLNFNLGAALSLVLMVLILICMAVMNHFDDDSDSAGGGILL